MDFTSKEYGLVDLQEEIRNLKEQVSRLSNLLWEMKKELDNKKSTYKKPWEDYK